MFLWVKFPLWKGRVAVLPWFLVNTFICMCFSEHYECSYGWKRTSYVKVVPILVNTTWNLLRKNRLGAKKHRLVFHVKKIFLSYIDVPWILLYIPWAIHYHTRIIEGFRYFLIFEDTSYFIRWHYYLIELALILYVVTKTTESSFDLLDFHRIYVGLRSYGNYSCSTGYIHRNISYRNLVQQIL
jgi:hypothetical protein